jgi:hypothetical protein
MPGNCQIIYAKFQTYHRNLWILIISWVLAPPFLTINYKELETIFSQGSIPLWFFGIIISIIALYAIILGFLLNKCIEAEQDYINNNC